MSTLKSSAEDLTLNADGSGNDIIFQSNGSNVATLDQAGTLTATTFTGAATDSTKLPLAGGTLTGDVSLVKASGNSQILVEASGTDAYATVRVKNDAKDYSMQIRSDQGDAWTVRDETVGANRIKVDGSTGDTILGGDLVFETAGKGICLGVTSNTDSNTLDDYEDGTCTLKYWDGSNETTGWTVHYTKIGSMVNLSGTIGGSAQSVSGFTDGNAVKVSGMPFAPDKEAISTYLGRYFNAPDNTTHGVLYAPRDQTYMEFYWIRDGANYETMKISEMHNTTHDTYFSLTYRTAS